MTWYNIQFDYTGNAPTKSQTYNFCVEDLGYEAENVEAVGPIEVKIDGSSKANILSFINGELPKKRSNTTYTKAL